MTSNIRSGDQFGLGKLTNKARNFKGLGRKFRVLAAVAAITVCLAPMAAGAQDGANPTVITVPGQSLASALVDLADQTGLQVLFASDDVAGLSSPGTSAAASPSQALQELLAGSGFTYSFVDGDTVSIGRIGGLESGVIALPAIVVRGEKIGRSYQDTFTSVGIATGDDIETYKFDDLHDVFDAMANVAIFNSNGGNRGFQIRGINVDGVTQPANSAPLVSVVIDGVPQSAEGLRRGSRGTWDVDQIEVLRGPQSTLQGRNALAGAVIVETNDPTYYVEAAARASFGTQNSRELGLTASGPIIDNQVAFRIAGEIRERKEDISYADPLHAKLGEDRFHSLRGKLLIEPQGLPDFRALLTISRTFDRPSTAVVTGPDFFARVFTSASANVEFREIEVDNYNVDLTYEINDVFRLHSVSSVNRTELDIKSVAGATILTPFGTLPFVRQDFRNDRDFAQDLRLEITENSSSLSGVVGVFFGNFGQEIETSINVGPLPLQVGSVRNETESRAIYTDLRYQLTDLVSFLGGLRYQEDTVRNQTDIVSTAIVGGFPVTSTTVSQREVGHNVFLPKLGVALDLDDEQTVALTATRGYRQGFAELQAGSATVINQVKPEYQWAYELAYRNVASNGGLTFGANLFYNECQDQQVTVTDPVLGPLTNTRNIGDSTSFGAELEGRYNFRNGLELFGSIGLLKTEFEQFVDVACAVSGGTCNGKAYPEAPTLNAAFGGAYRDGNGFFVSGNVNYVSDYYTDINNQAALEVSGRFIANTRIGYEMENVTVSVFVDNLLDKQYITGFAGTSAGIGEGRIVGTEIRLNF